MKYVPRIFLCSFSHVCHTRMIEYEVTAVVLVTFHIHVQGGGDKPTSILDYDTRSRRMDCFMLRPF